MKWKIKVEDLKIEIEIEKKRERIDIGREEIGKGEIDGNKIWVIEGKERKKDEEEVKKKMIKMGENGEVKKIKIVEKRKKDIER